MSRIHDEITLNLADLRAAFVNKTGAQRAHVHFEVKLSDLLGNKGLEYYVRICNGYGGHSIEVSVNSAYSTKGKTLDEAFWILREKIDGLRTYEDECADLGILPVATQIEEAA